MAKQKQQQEEVSQELPQEPQVEKPDVEEQEEPERLSRKECAHRIIAEIDGDCTLNELAEKADKLFVAGRGGDEEYSDPDSAAWHLRRELETLEGVGLLELSWECVVHPLVARLGLPSKNGK